MLIFADFQASSVVGGPYLNVAAGFGWGPLFGWDVRGRYEPAMIEFHDEAQYRRAARALAERAAEVADRYRRSYGSFDSAADLILSAAPRLPGGRPATATRADAVGRLQDPFFNAGVVCGLRGAMEDSAGYLRVYEERSSVGLDDLPKWSRKPIEAQLRLAKAYLAAVGSVDRFRDIAEVAIEHSRTQLRLGPWSEQYPWRATDSSI
jgi:hypothetical protein